MKAMLVFPPQWTPAMPHLALPVLTATLRTQGVDVVQRDLNLETYDAVLTRSYLEQSVEHLSARGGRGQRHDGTLADRLRWAREAGPGLAAQIDVAKASYRSPSFYDAESSLATFLVIAQALELAALPYHPTQLDLVNFEPALPIDSSRGLLQAARDPGRNMFLDIFRRGILPDIVREQPDLVGISIPTRGQMLAALTLAYLIRKAVAGCHITVGGPHVSMLREQIPAAPTLFELIDSAIVFDGELPLLRLAEALAGDGNLGEVPNLIYKAGSGMRVNAILPRSRTGSRRSDAATVTSLVPDFDGLPLDRYLAPDLVLPLITAHGCYHGRCAFCNVGYGADEGFYPLPVEHVVEQIISVQKKHGVRHIFFADEAIPPRSLRLLSAGLAELGSPVDWCGCARLEAALSEELLAGVARGGGRMLLFGLETGSERVIQHMRKGTCREAMSQVLQASARAGIWNHTFFFFGFPSETIEEAQETVNFLYAHQDWLHSASPGVFVLERASPVFAYPARFGVRRVIHRPDQDLAIYFDYEVEVGLDERLAHTIVERLLGVLPGKRHGQYYLQDVNRFLFASYLHAQGTSPPTWLADETV